MSDTPHRHHGKVKFFNEQKGFGFITRAGASDVFVHAKGLPSGVTSLVEGTPVSFVIVPEQKGPRATDVRLE